MNLDRNREATAVVTGLGLCAIAVFMFVSLYTHSPYDVMDYRLGGVDEVDNKAGILGAKLAHHAFCLYGAGAWVLTLFLLVFGGMMCLRKSASGFTMRTLGAVLMTLLVCTWNGAMDHDVTVSDSYPAGPGGLVGGAFIAPLLVNYFGRVGVYLLLVAIGILACLLIEQNATETLLRMFGRTTFRVAGFVFDRILGRRPLAALQPQVVPAGMPSAMIMPDPSPSLSKPLFRNAGAAAKAVPVIIDEGLSDSSVVPVVDERIFRVSSEALKSAKERAIQRVGEKESIGDEEISTLPKTDADEADRRRTEALRQADEAEAKRLERERIAKEQLERERIALEKLEKERAAKDHERIEQQARFEAAMVETAGVKIKTRGDDVRTDDAALSDEAHDEALEEEKQKTDAELYVNYVLPKYDMLIEKDITPEISSDTLRNRGATIVQTLWDFKIGARLAGIQSGPAVTMYELELDPGIRVQKVVGLQDNLAMAMKAENGVRIIAPIPGRNAIGLEIANSEDHTVRMRPILESPQFRSRTWILPIILGRDSIGNPLVADLTSMPHLLIAGTTGSGKSVCVNSIIMSLMIMRKPHEVKMLLVDPKQVEMTDFKGIPHLLSPVVTDMKLAGGVLTWAVQKMEQRYERMSKVGVRNISTFNKMSREDRLARLTAGEKPDDYMESMPYIVIVVDEFADLMMTSGKEIEQCIARLAQKARAAGIHVILATQRPSADVVTGLIKTNLPCRICFQVKSKLDSRIVLDQGGGEKLAGKGDMLFIGAGNSNLIRAKGVFIADAEIQEVVKACKGQAEPNYSDEVERIALQAAQGEGEDDIEPMNAQAHELDPSFDEAVEVFLVMGRASTSLLQRRMAIGYTRAAKLCDQMEARGIVGPDRGAKGRELLISQEGWDNFKRVRANNNGSAWGAKGSKDNPGRLSGDSPDPAAEEGAAELNEELVAHLEPNDGVPAPDDELD